ncbi:MAG: hypothetical protein JNL64_10170 [Blastocatellia bacterium]|nr:hypothetical protein [Blastocatellia bacterium]
MGRTIVLIVSSLLIILLFQVDSQATSCAINNDAREVTAYAQASIGSSFNKGFLFGICFAIFVATLAVLIKNRRILFSFVYGPVAFLTLAILGIINGMHSSCLGSGLDSFYYQLVIVILMLMFIGSLVLGRRKSVVAEPTFISLNND